MTRDVLEVRVEQLEDALRDILDLITKWSRLMPSQEVVALIQKTATEALR